MSNEFQKKALALVYSYIVSRVEKTDPFPKFEVYVVWFSKTLQNWKALVSTTLPDGMYYEVTYNGDRGETYIDAYKKFDNVVIKDEQAKDACTCPWRNDYPRWGTKGHHVICPSLTKKHGWDDACGSDGHLDSKLSEEK